MRPILVMAGLAVTVACSSGPGTSNPCQAGADACPIADAQQETLGADDGHGDVLVPDDGIPGLDTVVDDTVVVDDTDVVPPDAVDVSAGECVTHCDCTQGSSCVGGACVLASPPQYCCTEPTQAQHLWPLCPRNAPCQYADDRPGICGAFYIAPEFGTIIFNEVLVFGEVQGDPNGDGIASDPIADEFVELVNIGDEPVVMTGWQLGGSGFGSTHPRFSFPNGFTLAPAAAVVIFGGGTAPADSASTSFFVVNAPAASLVMGLALDDAGDRLMLGDSAGYGVAYFSFGNAATDSVVTGTVYPDVGEQSFSREPELTGPFVGHGGVSGANGALFSPGTRADGSSF